MSIFSELMEQLSDTLNMDIFPDVNNVVTLLIEHTIKIQIEPDEMDEFIIIAAMIEELPPGKFREHILRDSLKANYKLDQNPGILSYMYKNNLLMLHLKRPLGSLSVDDLVVHIKELVERAKKWKSAINEGFSAPTDEIPSTTETSKKSIFGF
jgi:hypothetical protein